MWVLHWRKSDKARYILSFMLTWTIGMFFAYVFSSAGPIFTGQFDPALAPRIGSSDRQQFYGQIIKIRAPWSVAAFPLFPQCTSRLRPG